MGSEMKPSRQTRKKRNLLEELKLAIMQGMFKPRERLTERTLAEQFGVSRTPVREALHKLAQMGMVRLIRNQGARVEDYSPEDIDALFLVRLHLEQLAGRLACRQIRPAEIQQLVRLNTELGEAVGANDFPRMVEKDRQFHFALLRSSRNPFLIRSIEDLRLRSYPISYYYWRGNAYPRRSLADHRRIIQALRRRDGEEMDRLTEAQLNNSRERYLKYLSQA